ncbi:MAG: hypothetical protein DELT_02987 [Desulfovibrio sp.]
MTKTIDNYYNRFDADKSYDEILFRDGYGAQASEHNELQGIFGNRVRSIAEALFKDGDIIRDAQIAVNAQTGEVQAGSGAVYLDGAVRGVAPATFHIPTSGSIAVGIHLIAKVISELDDASLYNPAVGTGTHGQPGAWRKQVTAQWGYEGDGLEGEFYVVHVVDDGVVRSKEAPPNLDSFNQGIARYDRDSTGGGTYVVSGLTVRAAEDAGGGAQIYTVAEGRARVHGYGIELSTSRRLSYDANPDLRYIDTEIHTADGTASQRLDVAHAPIHSISLLRATLQKTVNVVHGSYSGVSDALPDTAVVSIIQCKQGDTVYEFGTDYKKTGDTVDWSPTGNEPATGSTYECTYTYMTAVEPKEQDYDGFSVEGAVAGSSIILSYNQAIPRLDRLCVTQDGAFVWQKGVAAEYNPRAPYTPEGMLALATVYQTWRETRTVTNDGVRVVPFEDIEALNARLDYVLQEVARQRLEADVSTREAGARVGIFVDALMDDSCRDQGIQQSAAIFGGELTLSIAAAIHPLAEPLSAPIAPVYTPVVVLAQTLRTGSMLVNPYMAFDPLPAVVTLNPSVDQWTEIENDWTSAITKRFDTGHYVPGNSTLTSQTVTTATQVLSSTTSDLEYLRQIDVEFEIRGFGNGEILRSIVFDGIEVEPASEVVADQNGVAVGKFTIPANVPAGAKTVTFRGLVEGGSSGSAVFVGQGKLTVQTVRQVHTVVNYWVDPLAQTFVLEANSQICGVDLWFTAKHGQVRVQIREVSNGVPNRTVLAEAIVEPEQIVISGGGHTRVTFPVLVQLLASTEYAVVVLCDDAVTACAVAEMGKFDETVQKWVSSQPYTVGVLLSSSNASTWTAHQDRDLTFRLLEANFSAGVTSLNMGSVEVGNTTDIVMLSLDEAPTADTRVEYEIALPTGDSLLIAQGQPARLTTPVSGQISVTAKLTGTKKAAPLVWPGAQLLTGEVSQSDDYYSRSIPAIDATRAILIYDALIPSGTTVTPEIQIDSGEWQAMNSTGAVNQGDGVVEYSFAFSLSEATLAKCRFTLTGTSSARPSVRNIRFLAIK